MADADLYSNLDDLPADTDGLDFSPYVETLAGLLGSQRTRTPLTLGVFGDWGSGKTTLLRLVRKALPAACRTVWFDAWKYDQQETLWRALLLLVLTEVGQAIPEDEKAAHQDLDDLRNALYRTVDREEVGKVEIDGEKLLGGLAKGAVRIGLSFIPPAKVLADLVAGLGEKSGDGAGDDLLGAIRRERTQIHVDQVQFLEQFQERFEKLVKKYVIGRGEGAGRLVVFVDDLDRCLPEKAVEVLEAIKLFLDVRGCAFALGLAPDVIARGIEMKYREFGVGSGEGAKAFPIDGARYLEKIIQIPFQIPPIEAEDMRSFVNGLVDTWPDPACAEVFAVGLGGSPRQVKRAVNVFLLTWGLAGARKKKLGDRIKPIRLAKVVVLQHAAPGIYAAVRETPRLLRELERYYRAEEARGGEWGLRAEVRKVAPGGEEETGESVGPPPGLAGLVANPAARRVLTLHPPTTVDANFAELSPEELKPYFTLTRSAEAPVPLTEEALREFFEPELVRVPAGKFVMGSTEAQVEKVLADGKVKKEHEFIYRAELPQHEVELPEYRIGKYPVTNLEYQRFVREGKHRSPEGWAGDAYPEGKGDHPVVSVSWDDTRAFCDWLTEKTGKARNYRLPSEAEWEKAARGTDGRIYPWGNDWDPQRANSADGGPGGTTPVGQDSPLGDSPCGAADLAGNVWEWTQSEYKPYPYVAADGRENLGEASRRVLRGGAFSDQPWLARCAVRYGLGPGLRDLVVGFRVVVSPFRSGL